MSISKTLAAVALATLALAGCQPAAPPAPDNSADEAVIRASAPAWAAAYNAADADKLAGMYWDDSVLFPPNVPAVAGGTPLRDYFATETAGFRAAGLTMNIPEAGAARVSGDLAYEAGTYSITDASGATVETGKYIGVFETRNGEWRYIRDTWNADTPPPAAATADGPGEG